MSGDFAGFAKDIAVIDFESTGFVKNVHGDTVDPGEPTQIGGVLLDATTLEEKSHYLSDVKADPKRLDPWVLEHTDITAERVVAAPQRSVVAKQFIDAFPPDSVFLATWNVAYDRHWLNTLMQSIEHTESFYDYHHLDVWTLAYTYLASHGHTNTIRSEETFQLFGQSTRGAHNALDDCRRTADVLRAIVFDKGITT